MTVHRSMALAAVLAVGAMSNAHASTVYTVGTTAELIAAIRMANQDPTADIITLERGLYVLDTMHEPSQRAALPSITSPIVIRGNGAELRRYAGADFRLLHVAEEGHLRLERTILAEGSLGAIRNHGRVEMVRVSLVDSTAESTAAIIENYGQMRLEHCEVSFNTVAGAERDAGTIVNWGNLKLLNTNFEGNTLTRRYDGVALATSVLNYGSADVEDVVISDNVAQGEDARGAPRAPLVNLGNGRLKLRLVRERDNLPAAGLVARNLLP